MELPDFDRRPTGKHGLAAPRQCLFEARNLRHPKATHMLIGA